MDINWSSFIQFQKTIGDSESENHPLSNEPTPVILIIIVWAQLANIWPPKKLGIRKSTTILEKAKNRFFSKSARWMIFYCLVSVSYSQGDIRTIEKQWVMSFLTWRFRQTPLREKEFLSSKLQVYASYTALWERKRERESWNFGASITSRIYASYTDCDF